MLALIALSSIVVGCGIGGSASDQTLTVFAAASLTESFEEIGNDFEQQHQDVTVEFNFAGSQALVTQLVQRARADVFASANQQQMERAQSEGVIAADATTFAENALVIIVPADNPAGITELADLATPGIKLVVAAEDVPVGAYTRQMLDNASQDSSFGATFREQVEANIVSNESNVKQVVTKVQLGEADAGVVYLTDVTAEVRDEIDQIEIPDEINVVASYPIAPVTDGNQELASTFIDFVLSDAGQEILASYGFRPAP